MGYNETVGKAVALVKEETQRLQGGSVALSAEAEDGLRAALCDMAEAMDDLEGVMADLNPDIEPDEEPQPSLSNFFDGLID